MTDAMSNMFNMELLNNEFHEIAMIMADILEKKEIVYDKLARLKKIYNDLIKNNAKKIFLFCLDSFYFQYKLLNIEIEQLSKNITLINNRAYGDYYKLYNIMLTQLKEKNIILAIDAANSKKFPVYKDLEPYHEYTIENISEIHYEILKMVGDVNVMFNNKHTKINEYIESSQVGISITNFISTLEYENNLLREQINLYVNYINYFHDIQRSHFTKMLNKVNAFHREIEQDILSNRKSHLRQPVGILTTPRQENTLKDYFTDAKTSLFTFTRPGATSSIASATDDRTGVYDSYFAGVNKNRMDEKLERAVKEVSNSERNSRLSSMDAVSQADNESDGTASTVDSSEKIYPDNV